MLGAPMDWTTSYKPGTRFGPRSIRDAVCNLEFFSLVLGRPVEDLVVFNDLGDVSLPPGSVVESLERIRRVVEGVREDFGENIIVLGGEHLVSLPVIETLHNDIDILIVVDAHLDQRDEYLGNKLSHATVMRRVFEKTGIPIIYIGARAISPEEYDYAVKHGNKIKLYMPHVLRYSDKMKEIADIINNKKIYLSIDMDGLDPGYAPGVSNPEPIGITSYQLIELLKIINEHGDLIAADIVEVNPLGDINDVTSLLAAKMLVEITAILMSKKTR